MIVHLHSLRRSTWVTSPGARGRCFNEEFKEKQIIEREIADREASERLKQAEEFIDNVKSPVVKDKHKIGDIDIGNELECPVCFQEMKPPVHIWQCAQVSITIHHYM